MIPYTLLDLATCVKGEVNALLEIRNASYPHVLDTYSPILATATWPRFSASSSAATAAASAEANAGMATGTKTPMIVKTAPIIKSASCEVIKHAFRDKTVCYGPFEQGSLGVLLAFSKPVKLFQAIRAYIDIYQVVL